MNRAESLILLCENSKTDESLSHAARILAKFAIPVALAVIPGSMIMFAAYKTWKYYVEKRNAKLNKANNGVEKATDNNGKVVGEFDLDSNQGYALKYED